MKIASIILSFFLLGTSIIPCSDLSSASFQWQQSEIQLVQQDHNHDGTHSGSFDVCSPFCSCHCCHTHVIVNSQLDINWKLEDVPNKPSPYYSNYLPSPSFSIWQPPKIA